MSNPFPSLLVLLLKCFSICLPWRWSSGSFSSKSIHFINIKILCTLAKNSFLVLLFMYMGVLPHVMQVVCVPGPEEGVKSPETGVSSELLCGCWKLNPASSSTRVAIASNLWAISQDPHLYFLKSHLIVYVGRHLRLRTTYRIKFWSWESNWSCQG